MQITFYGKKHNRYDAIVMACNIFVDTGEFDGFGVIDRHDKKQG